MPHACILSSYAQSNIPCTRLSLDIACLAQSITLSKSRQGMLSFIVTSIVFYRRIIEYHGVKRQAATKVDIMSVINRLSFMSLDTPDRWKNAWQMFIPVVLVYKIINIARQLGTKSSKKKSRAPISLVNVNPISIVQIKFIQMRKSGKSVPTPVLCFHNELFRSFFKVFNLT